MAVKSDSATSGEKELKTDWPITEGLELGTTKLRKKAALEAEEDDLAAEQKWGSL